MAVLVEATNFSGRFVALNGTASLNVTRRDIIRSLLTVGYPSRKAAIDFVGPWRAKMLAAMAKGYLDNSLNTTSYFRNLEQSEKVGASFLFGEAFTHWYAQDRMSIEFLVHVAGLKTCRWMSSSQPVVPKAGAASPASKSRPDFIGIRRQERHVFESKGRIRSPAASTVAKALGQVSVLQTINGSAPTTRCACFFMLKSKGTEGKVVDPPGGTIGLSVKFDQRDALAKAYSFFLDRPTVSLSDQIGEGYVGHEIEEGLFFGIDKHVLAAIAERPPTEADRWRRVVEVFDILAARAQVYESRRGFDTSSGRDGTLLVDRREPRSRRIRFPSS